MKDSTHITIVFDRSGSMASVQEEAQQAVNSFISSQKEHPGECSLYFVDFDGEDAQHVIHNGPLATAPVYRLNPRGMTPLLDAVGRAINFTGKRLEALPESERPEHVLFVIQTDGHENASSSFTWERVKGMIKEQTDVYSWQFVFLGMGSDAWDGGSRLGVGNVVTADANNGISNANTHSVMSAYTSSYRSGRTHDMSAMRGMHVNSAGRVFNQVGEEVDPNSGEVITPSAATS